MDSSPHPLQVMVSDFDQLETSPQNVSKESDGEKPEAPRHVQITEQISDKTPAIGLSGIKPPALLVNCDLEIEWQNKGAIDQIWQNIGAANNGNPTANLLDLIFDLSFKRLIVNFPQCLEFFLNQVLGLVTADELHGRLSGMPDDRKHLIMPLIEKMIERDADRELYGGYFKLKMRSGRQISFKVVALNCDESRLLLFDPQPDDASGYPSTEGQGVTHRVEHIRRQPNPVMTPHFLLAAEISRASVLRTEMLAEDHWRLINTICRGCLRHIEHFGGAFGQHVGHGFFAYFLPDHNREADPMRVIECALEIRAEAVELGRKWKISKNWLHDIDLNIGVHFEKAYVGTLPVSSGDVLTSFGDGLRVAYAISQRANDGQIWVTKPVISRIPPARSKTLRFGIERTNRQHHKTFLRNAFASIDSVFENPTAGGTFQDELGFIPVTQVFDLSGANE